MFTDAEKQSIRTLLAGAPYAGQPAAEQVRLLTTRPVVENPKPPPEAPAPMTRTGLLDLVSADSFGKIPDLALEAVGERARAQDHAGVRIWIERAAAKGWITAHEHAACKAKLAETVPNLAGYRTHVETDSPLEQALGRPVHSLSVEVLQAL